MYNGPKIVVVILPICFLSNSRAFVLIQSGLKLVKNVKPKFLFSNCIFPNIMKNIPLDGIGKILFVSLSTKKRQT